MLSAKVQSSWSELAGMSTMSGVLQPPRVKRDLFGSWRVENNQVIQASCPEWKACTCEDFIWDSRDSVVVVADLVFTKFSFEHGQNNTSCTDSPSRCTYRLAPSVLRACDLL